MSIRPTITRCALLATAALLLLAPASGAAVNKKTAKLRVLTPDRVIDPGTTYVVGDSKVATDPNADCFGGAGGSGATYEYGDDVAISLLAAGARANGNVRPLSLTDEFGFGLGICGIGGVEADQDNFWYLKKNHEELSVGIDQEPLAKGDELLIYLAPNNYPEPNPAELELRAPARAKPGEPIRVKVLEHACVTDPETFEVSCTTSPAEGATVSGVGGDAVTGADGTVELVAATPSKRRVLATRGEDIPSERLEVCFRERLSECAPVRGERVLGTSERDRVKGGRGDDEIHMRGGRDRIDLRKGGRDEVDCGAGRDTVIHKRSDRDDRIGGDCERIRRR